MNFSRLLDNTIVFDNTIVTFCFLQMVNLRLSRRPTQKQRRLRNVLLVGSKEEREEFLDYIEVDVNQTEDKGKNYKWKNRNLLNIPCGIIPRPEAIYTTDVVIYFVDCEDMSSYEAARQYALNLLHVGHHLVVASNYRDSFTRCQFFRELSRYTDVSLFTDDDEDEVESYLKQLTRKVRV